jgi:photosystem II Psb27 protein
MPIAKLLLMSLASAAAFSAVPSKASSPLTRSKVHMSQVPVSVGDAATRRGILAAGVAAFAAAAFDFAPAEAADYVLAKEYIPDATNLIANMKLATNLTRGAPNFEETVVATRKEMNAFVAYYRRQARYSGAQSFNTLYTAINTLSGHYASFGNTYPVPAKRRDRLTVQYKEIEKYLKKGR